MNYNFDYSILERMRVNREIKEIFLLRERAVKQKDRKLFLSTQIDEIAGSSSHGYLSIDKLETKILAIDFRSEDKLATVVVSKETYFFKGKKSHSALLIYHLVNSVEGWKIYNIIH